MFHIGEEVICILGGKLGDSSPNLHQFPVKGQKYTIRGIQTSPYKHLTGQVGILVEEIVNDICPHSQLEWDYFSRRFRKIVKDTTKTDITVFEKLLNSKPTDLPEPPPEKVKKKEKEKVE